MILSVHCAELDGGGKCQFSSSCGEEGSAFSVKLPSNLAWQQELQELCLRPLGIAHHW